MTTDVIALTERMPDAWSLVAGLMAGGPDMGVATVGEGAVIQLCDDQGRPLASIEAPMLVRTPGEVARLLGPGAAGVTEPVWWTEVRASTAARNSAALAGALATRLVTQLGGAVWPPEAAAADGGAAPVADVVTASAPAAAQPAVDVLTDSVAAVIQDRPVVAMTAWLSDALRAALESERGLQIVTPRTSRLSLPTRSLLSGLPNRWVVQDGEGGYFDGQSGSGLVWKNGAFTATGTPAPAFVAATAEAADTGEQQLLLTGVTCRPADRGLQLGGALETLWQRLTGAPPAGWGTAEPANLSWSRQELTELARRRAPDPSLFMVVGDPSRPAVSTMRVGRTTGGVEEDLTLALGYREGAEPPLDTLPDLAAELVAGHGLVSLLIQRRRGRADLTVPAHLEAAPAPVAFVLGAEAVRDLGLARARRVPLPDGPVQLGPASGAGLYYPVPDGSWDAFQALMGYLHSLGKERDADR
ncbi:DUF6177 family protein [Streptomyces sp. ACA25]|uniref:DUF6177 family protein n=1 Tax=Streptomyces sp. ACA25 TaxID=3022596 RepID=UPI002307EC93|nr:DUF6177 family protein [Streptomyces sp. ACA25]MDB1090329.1 DUF6177 family protein [Streptomyces sp. ACA25]